MNAAHLTSFEEHRRVLFGIAYRMLGSVTEAEDMVQETYLRWQKQDLAQIQSARAWLTAATTRLCIDQLRSARKQREEYVGVWLPEPLADSSAAPAAASLADSLNTAFLILLETLSPEERAIFLLHEAFEYGYPEISRLVGKSEAACRQTVHRARSRVSLRKNRFIADPRQHEQVILEFQAACRQGEVGKLLALLGENVTLFSDGGGKVSAVPRPLAGAARVARFLIGVARLAEAARSELRFCVLNGEPGLLRYLDGKLVQTYIFEITEDRIQNVYIMRNPDKLRHLARELAGHPELPDRSRQDSPGGIV